MQRTVIDDRYTLIEPLGDGGMARVYLAHDEVLDRDVAIKVLRDAYADDEEFVERFRREARSVAGLAHPNIVSVFDQGRSEDGAYYIAMEYVPRGTLKDRIKRSGPLAPAAAAGVAQQIADALSAAHEKGVVHRDIKPQNVLVTASGDVKVTDFGIARAASLNTLTATSAVMGTAAYMSPEQALGRPVGPESDLYSLGVVLYEMLTGQLPYTSEDAHPVALAMKHVNEPVPSPRKANPNVPEDLDAITTRLLAKKPEDRYASAGGLAHDLERSLSGGSPSAVPTAKMEKETEKMTAPLPPATTPPRERTQRTAVQPPVAAPVRGTAAPGKRRGSRLLPALGALLLGVLLLGGLALGLRENGSEDVSQPQGSEDTSGADVANETPEPSPQAIQSLPPANAAVQDGAAVDDVSAGGTSAGAAPPPTPPAPVAPPGAGTGNGGSGNAVAPPIPNDSQEQQEELQEQKEEQQEERQEKQEERQEKQQERQGKKDKGKDKKGKG